jgi:hypothetical protein
MQMFSLIWRVGNSCLFVCDGQSGYRLPLQIRVKNTISLRSATLISCFLTWVVPSKLCCDEQFNTCDKTTVIRGEERDGSFMRVIGKKRG